MNETGRFFLSNKILKLSKVERKTKKNPGAILSLSLSLSFSLSVSLSL
jgi:hypothetical protein